MEIFKVNLNAKTGKRSLVATTALIPVNEPCISVNVHGNRIRMYGPLSANKFMYYVEISAKEAHEMIETLTLAAQAQKAADMILEKNNRKEDSE
jgi:hypothetical protein